MYSREYPSKSSGAVKAFEDAYAREEFLRRSAEKAEQSGGCAPKPEIKNDNCGLLPQTAENKNCGQNEFAINNDTAKPKGGLAGLFGGTDSGDLILLLLIVFFLFDADKEKDSVIPILLTVLLLF